jgi:hypothetical protein
MARPLAEIGRKFGNLPTGVKIGLLVVVLMAGRYGWICANRPPHRREITLAHATKIFFNGPQADAAGQHALYVATAEHGIGVFMADMATGRTTEISATNQTARGMAYHDFTVWPWAPDGRAFIHTEDGEIVLAKPETPQTQTRLRPQNPVHSLAWINPRSFVCQEADDLLYRFDQQAEGSWKEERLWSAESVLRSDTAEFRGSNEHIAKGIDSREVSPTSPVNWSSGRTVTPIWVQYHFRGAAWSVADYAVSSGPASANTDPRDWRLLGSNDGDHWTVLDARIKEAFTAHSQRKEYAFLNHTPYWFYRLDISATANATPTNVIMGGFELWTPGDFDQASAIAENTPDEGAAKAFDGSTGTKWYNNAYPPPCWLQYSFGGGAAWAVTQYQVASANDSPERDPKNWQLQASDDGIDWTTLDTRTGEMFDSRFQTKTYSVTNATPYRCYRLLVSRTAARSFNKMQLSELELEAADADGRLTDVSRLRHPFSGAFSLAGISNNTVVWGNDCGLWTMGLNGGAPLLLMDFRRAAPELTLHGCSYSPDTGKFLLSCAEGTNNCLRVYDPRTPDAKLQVIDSIADVRDAVWTHAGNNHGWVGREEHAWMAQSDLSAAPKGFLPYGRIEAIDVVDGGRQIFLRGAVSNEPSAGIWQYDVASGRLQSVAPYADAPSSYATYRHTLSDYLLEDSKKYAIYISAGYYRNPHRHYPLILGSTDENMIDGDAYGRNWAKAMADAGAFVVMARHYRWDASANRWMANLASAYDHITSHLPIDQQRVYLLAVQHESQWVPQALAKWPGRWRGAILVAPVTLPELSNPSPFVPQAENIDLHRRVRVRCQSTAPISGKRLQIRRVGGSGHCAEGGGSPFGNAAQRQWNLAMMHLVFDE